MYVIVAVVAIFFTLMFVGVVSNKLKPKRFGLKEAEAAAQYLGNDPAAAKPVMGVVCGVLGYENKVGADLAALKAEKDAENAKRSEERKANLVEIGRLEAEIEKVKAANDELGEQIDNANALVADKAEVAALFQS